MIKKRMRILLPMVTFGILFHVLPVFAGEKPENTKENNWQTLFDGSSLDAWRGYCKDSVPQKWVIEDGLLRFKDDGSRRMNDPKTGGDLITKAQYENFEFEMEWRISKGGNSGILYLAREVCAGDGKIGQPIYMSAPEMQILDNDTHEDAKKGKDGNRKAGSLYDLIPAAPQNANPAGEWNHVKIKINNGKVSHWMNGETVVEYELWSDDWIALNKGSKFESWPNFINTAKKGYIGLQDHGDDIWFRNIRIREL